MGAWNWIEIDHNGNLKAVASVERYQSTTPWITDLFRQDFSTPISFDTPYVLSTEFTGSKFIFKCNNETACYEVTTNTYEPYYESWWLRQSSLQSLQSTLSAWSGGSGYLKVDFDDVYTGGSGDASGGGDDGGGGGCCFISTAANGSPMAPLGLPGLY